MVNTYKKKIFVGNFFVSSYMQTPLRVSKSRSLYVMLISFVYLKLFFIKKKKRVALIGHRDRKITP